MGSHTFSGEKLEDFSRIFQDSTLIYMNLLPTKQNVCVSTRSMQKCQTMQGELENTWKRDIHCALVAQWTYTKVMKEQWEKKTSVFTHFVRSSRIYTLKLLSVDVFRFCSIKKSRTFKNQNQFQILSRPLNRTPEIKGLSRCILTLK